MVTGRLSAGSNMSSFVLHKGHFDCSMYKGLKTKNESGGYGSNLGESWKDDSDLN